MRNKETGCISRQCSCPCADSAISSCSDVCYQDSLYSDDELTDASHNTLPSFSPDVELKKPHKRPVPLLHDLCIKLLRHAGSDEVLQSVAKLELEMTGLLLHNGRQWLTVANQEDEEAEDKGKETQSDQDIHHRRDDENVNTDNTTTDGELSRILDDLRWNTDDESVEKEAVPEHPGLLLPSIYMSSEQIKFVDQIVGELLDSRDMCQNPISSSDLMYTEQKDFKYGNVIKSESNSKAGKAKHAQLMADDRPAGTDWLDLFSVFFLLSVVFSDEKDTEQQNSEQSAPFHPQSLHDHLEHHSHTDSDTERGDEEPAVVCSLYTIKENQSHQLEASHSVSSSEESEASYAHDGLGSSAEDHTYRRVEDDSSTDDTLAANPRHTPTQCEDDEGNYKAEIAILQYSHDAKEHSENAHGRHQTDVACHDIVCKRDINTKQDVKLSRKDANCGITCQVAADKNLESDHSVFKGNKVNCDKSSDGDHSLYKENQIRLTEKKPRPSDTKALSKKDVPYRCVVVDMEVGANRLVRPRNKRTIVHTTHPPACNPSTQTTDQKLKTDEKPDKNMKTDKNLKTDEKPDEKPKTDEKAEQSSSEPSRFYDLQEKEESVIYKDKEENNPLSRHFNRFQLSPEFREFIVSMMGESTREGGQRGLENEWTRLATFDQCGVPPGIYIVRIAANGFFIPTNDMRHPGNSEVNVQCAFCGVRVPLLQFRGREAGEVHSRVSPGCRFVQGDTVGNIAISDTIFSSASRFMDTYPSPVAHGEESMDTNQPTTTTHTLPPTEILATDSSASFPIDALTVEDAVSGATVPGAFSTLPNQHGALTTLPNQTGSLSALPNQSGALSALPNQSRADLGRQPESNSHAAAETTTARFEESGGSSRFQPSPSATTANSGSQGLGSDVTRSGEGSSSSTENGQERQVVTYEDLGIFAQTPKRPDMAVTQIRINTFTNWPHEATHPSSRMAEAGFYFTGHADLVRCFHCKGGLKTWESSDQPWVEHSRWFPRCHFVRLAKGQKFVDVVQRLNDPETRPRISEEQVMQGVQELEDEERRRRAEQPLITTRPLVAPSAPANPYAEAMQRVGLRQGTDISDETMQELSERLEEDNNDLRNERLCKVCQTEQVNILFLPCGHLVACAQCAPALRTCAICRQAVKGSVRVLLDDILDDHENMEEGEPRGRTDHATGTI